VPVALVAAALEEGQGGHLGLMARAAALMRALEAAGADLRLAPQGLDVSVCEGLAILQGRRLITADLKPRAAQRNLLQFYAASVQQRLDVSRADAITIVDSMTTAP
jgi:hypothetical protein